MGLQAVREGEGGAEVVIVIVCSHKGGVCFNNSASITSDCSPPQVRKDLVALLALVQSVGHVEGSQVLRFLGLQLTIAP